MKVAIQGELGSFSHEAARRMVPGCTLLPCARSVEVFDHLEAGDVPVAVIPIENTLAGTVTEHADLLLARDVFIQREFHLRIIHNLIAAPGVKKQALRRAFSHPVALDQCRDFFRNNPKVQAMPFYDTAGSVKHVVESGLRDAAGIASRHAASVYKGRILAAGIEDDKRNLTRFFLLRRGKQKRLVRGANKSSIAFGLKNIPGALHKALRVFADRISFEETTSWPAEP
jgi:prephenate dehydratase